MSDKRSNEQLDSLRERLYSRGEEPSIRPRTEIRRENDITAPRKDWSDSAYKSIPKSVPVTEEIIKKPVKKYRYILLLVGLVFFVLSLAASSIYIMLGRNTVSGSNISVGITAPLTAGGGEVLPFQVGVTNHNSISIESATLVVEYPAGTRSADEDSKDLFSERVPIPQSITAGETRNISLKARVFGEENQEKEIKVSIEYRMVGSSATFYKEAEPLRFKISHAPVLIKVDTAKTVPAEQENRIRLVLTSNSPAPIYDLLVKADYPGGFNFIRSEPATVSGRNIWQISEIKPEQSATIDLYGSFSGSVSDSYVLKFSTGVASERNPNELVSVLAVADAEFTLEESFLSATMSINGSQSDKVSVSPGSQATAILEVRNNSSRPVYDAVVSIKLSGNALVDSRISATGGNYDSSTRTITFDKSSSARLAELKPGATERLTFYLVPQSGPVQSPQIGLDVGVSGRRISDSSAKESIDSIIKRTISVEGKVSVSGKVNDVTAGAVPPVVNKETDYRIELLVNNSGNNLGGVIITATLPPSVDWIDNSSGAGSWNYDITNRTIEWRVGNVSNNPVKGTFGVSLLPTSALLGKTPVLVENIQLRADDSFTGSVLRSSGGNITAEISGQNNSGIVKSN